MDVKKLQDKYYKLMHAMQSGVALMMNYDKSETSPKHLRVGVNSALIDSSALAKLLIEKKIITEEEFYTALCELAENDVKSYEQKITEITGSNTKITLG